jgi:hypothetical protein
MQKIKYTTGKVSKSGEKNIFPKMFVNYAREIAWKCPAFTTV